MQVRVERTQSQAHVCLLHTVKYENIHVHRSMSVNYKIWDRTHTGPALQVHEYYPICPRYSKC